MKTNRKNLVDKLDKLISQIVRAYEHGICEHCKGKANQCHHYFGRMRYSTRFEFDNCLSLCWVCHRYWAHQKYEDCRDYLISRIGQKRFDELKLLSNQTADFSESDLEEKVAEYSILLKNLNETYS